VSNRSNEARKTLSIGACAVICFLAGCGSGNRGPDCSDGPWVTKAIFSPDGNRIVYVDYDYGFIYEKDSSFLKIFDAHTGKLQLSLFDRGSTFRVDAAYSADGRTLARADGDIRLYDGTTDAFIRKITAVQAGIVSVAFSPDGKRVVGGTDSKDVRVLDMATGAQILILQGHTDYPISVAYSPDGSIIASAGSGDQTVRLWNAETGSLLQTLSFENGYTSSVAFLPTGHILAAAMGRSIVLWDAQTGASVSVLRGHTDNIGSMSISSDGKKMVTTSQNDLSPIRLWDLQTGVQTGTIPADQGCIVSAALAPGGSSVAVLGHDPNMRLFDVGSQTVLWSKNDIWRSVPRASSRSFPRR